MTQMSSPMKSFSMSLRVSTSMSVVLCNTPGCASSPRSLHRPLRLARSGKRGLQTSLVHVCAVLGDPAEIGPFLTISRRARSADWPAARTLTGVRGHSSASSHDGAVTAGLRRI